MAEADRQDDAKIDADEDFSLRIVRKVMELEGNVVRETTVVLNAKGGFVDKILAYVFGVIFVATVLVLAIFFPNPTDFQYTVFRIVLALAAGGVAAVIPGFIDIKFKTWLRAGGALAVFVIVFFLAPAALQKTDASPAQSITKGTSK